MLDFDQAGAIMDMGYEDAMAAMPQLLEKVAERRDSAYYAGRREAFRAKCPPLVFDDYKLEGLKRAQREYIRDFVQVDRRTPGIQRPMGFTELRDNIFEVLAGGDFTMDFPSVRYDSVRERYSFEAKFGTRPNFKITFGGNISSTAFNQAYIGINYKTIGRVAQQLGADLYLGPIYTWGARSEAGRISTRGSRYSSITPTISRSGISATAISATSPRSATPSRSRTARVSSRRAPACR